MCLPELIESSHRGNWGQLFDDLLDDPTSLDPNYEIDPLVPLGREEVPNVHPADFLALYGTKGLSLKLIDTCADRTQGTHKTQNFLTAAVKYLQTAKVTSISYNPRTRTINLRGPVTLIKSAKDNLQAVILDVSRESGLQYLQKKQKELQQKTNVNPLHGTWNTLTNQTFNADLSANIFALRVQQDSITVTTWVEFLLPKLPAILDPAIGQDYTASLVRQGASEYVARPQIRIQSPRKLRKATRKNIIRAIDEICESNTRAIIQVSFCTGYLRLLTNVSSMHYSIDSETEEDDDPEFLFKRYWHHPGMGASIGMRCTRLVSATLGGYVLVDESKLLLTVNHFIERSYTVSPGGRDLITLTSPSLCDVDEMRERLDTTMRSLNAQFDLLSQKPGDIEISLNGVLPQDMQEIRNEMNAYEEYQSEISRPKQDFVLGKLAGCCKTDAILSIDAESPSSSESVTSCRMDWALFSIENRRSMGENRHRFQSGSEADLVETACENNPNWTGNGDFCNDTCDLEPSASVHYVGQRSGPRKGQINAVPMILRRGGVSTKEWALICPEQISRSECCEGDSGAWVLRDSDNKLVGLLWGWIDGQLLFSPINNVFADIKNTLSAREVRLPRDQINRDPPVMAISGNAASEPVLICAVKKQKPVKPYKLSTMLRSKLKRSQSISRAKDSIGNEAVTSKGTSSAFETQDMKIPLGGRKNRPAASYDPVSSDSSPKLDIASPIAHSSSSHIADTCSIGQASAENQPQEKCKKVTDFLHQDSKLPTTDLYADSIMHKHRQLTRAGSAGPECIPHTKCQSPLRYILLPVSANHLAFKTSFLSESQPMKITRKSSTFPFSQRDTAAHSKGHDFKSRNSHLRSGKLKDLSQSNLLSKKSLKNMQTNVSRSTYARRDETNG